MPRRENQKLKTLHVMRILSEETDENHPVTVNEIIEKLDACGIHAERKSIYDDINTLGEFGLDIEHKGGKSGGYYIGERKFETSELKLLVDAVQSSKFITEKKSNELIRKIESLTGKYEAADLRRSVHVASRIKNMNESIYYSVDNIHRAISENRKISFKYFDLDEKKEKILRHNGKVYTVSPWRAVWDDENYYLSAYDSESGIIKNYRIDKMLDIRIENDSREGKEAFEKYNPSLYSKSMFGMHGGNVIPVTLRCENSTAHIVIDRFGADANLIPDGKEHFLVTVDVVPSVHFLTWTMNFDGKIKAVSPQNIIDKITSLARDVIEEYVPSQGGKS